MIHLTASNHLTFLYCSFLLTSEEKEPKKTATPKAPFKGGCKSCIWEDPNPCYFWAGRDFGLYCLSLPGDRSLTGATHAATYPSLDSVDKMTVLFNELNKNA
jgi:hypothetical protein